MLLDQGRDEEALRHLAEAVSARPDLVEARNNFGTALLRAGRLAESREQFSRSCV
jgi:Flp pilus assembly protein TadD